MVGHCNRRKGGRGEGEGEGGISGKRGKEKERERGRKIRRGNIIGGIDDFFKRSIRSETVPINAAKF